MSERCDCGHGQHVHVGYVGGCGLCDSCTGFRVPEPNPLHEHPCGCVNFSNPCPYHDTDGVAR